MSFWKKFQRKIKISLQVKSEVLASLFPFEKCLFLIKL